MIIVAASLVTVVALTVIYLTLSYKCLIVVRDLVTAVPRLTTRFARHAKGSVALEEQASDG
jgi:hypothetical protein